MTRDGFGDASALDSGCGEQLAGILLGGFGVTFTTWLANGWYALAGCLTVFLLTLYLGRKREWNGFPWGVLLGLAIGLLFLFVLTKLGWDGSAWYPLP